MAKLPESIAAFFNAAEKPVIYFAHPMSTYGSQLEKQAIAALEARGYTVFNPGAGWVQREVQAYKKANPETIMDLFAAICNACVACAVLPFPASTVVDTKPEPLPRGSRRDDDYDDFDTDEAPDYLIPPAPLMLGAGVVYEMETFFNRRAPVFEVTVEASGAVNVRAITSFAGYRKLDVAQTRAALKQYRPK